MIGKKLKLNLFILATLIVSLSTPPVQAANEDTVKSYIEDYYVDKVDPSLLEKDLDTIFDQLDPYSTYFTKDEYQTFKDSINQKFVGIGVGIEKVEEGILLNRVFEDSPAKQAGLHSGDIILSADGTSLKGKSIEEAVTYIKGEAGTSVDLTVLQGEELNDVTVQRKEIQLPSVEGERLGGNIGYVQLYTFSHKTAAELNDVASELDGVDQWIIDVRNNPGGYLKASQQVLGFFPNVSNAIIAEFRNSNLSYEPIEQDYTFKEPVSLLINENSASASEIVAGALQDYDSATLYGTTTFGKGLLQELLSLPDGGAVKLSTARFFTPNHNKIQDVGIKPDINSEQPLADAHRVALVESNDYKTFEKDQVSPTKTFEIQLSSPVKAQSVESSIELIELGGDKVEFNLTSEDEDTLLLDPKSELSPDRDYMIMIHPGWENKNGKTSTQGVIQPVDVE
ncbi:S41 family peptidase [Pontibacillus sp. HMF3514]|uniref:S41 family peptidase n=1 Tax=Pontibacillus sp. HMF3514 TaxID=2692425 RepID=UPI0013201D7A|nr:S41 family peptidase [Pontibacillus sp. HMF3514]QHE53614.1 PDZ domain-containing protein [Pontibacillus sp. HMF3514]